MVSSKLGKLDKRQALILGTNCIGSETFETEYVGCESLVLGYRAKDTTSKLIGYRELGEWRFDNGKLDYGLYE